MKYVEAEIFRWKFFDYNRTHLEVENAIGFTLGVANFYFPAPL